MAARFVLAITASLLALVGAAQAHGIYIAQRAGQPTVVLGHGAEDLPYAPTKLTRLQVHGADGAPLAVPVEHLRGQASVTLPPEAASISATYFGGWHGKTAEGKWKPGARGEHADVARVGEYHKHTLFIAGGAAQLPGLPAGELAILPLQNPLVLRAGQSLAVKVMFRGKPLAGARVVGDYVNSSHTVSARTGRDGVARVRLRNQALNVIAVTHEDERPGEKTDFEEHLATLSFILPYHDRH